MFYLIDEKDGLFGEKILVNALNLKGIEIITGDEDYSVRFSHKDDEKFFTFDPNHIFNVNQVITEIANHSSVQYNNNFLVVTDLENINSISSRFGHFSNIIHKTSKILININDFGMVYEDDGTYVITTAEKNMTIQESPEEVYQQLLAKIVTVEHNTVDNKTKWKTTL